MSDGSGAPAWAGGFLRVLGGCGNVTLAAREAGLSRSRLYALRRREPGFAGAWDKALAGARMRLAAAGEAVPGPAGGDPGGGRGPRRGAGELVRWRSKAGVQLTRPGMLTPAKTERFLAVLRECCNVTIACEAVGVRRGTAYLRRRTCADFRAAWDTARIDGYDRIEMAMVGAAAALMDGEADAAELGGMSAATALGLLNYHRRGMTAAQGCAGPPELPIEEVRARVLAQIEAIEAMERAAGFLEDEPGGGDGGEERDGVVEAVEASTLDPGFRRYDG